VAEVNGSPAGTVPAEPCTGGGAALRQASHCSERPCPNKRQTARNLLSTSGIKATQQVGVGLKSEPKIAFQNKGLMIAIYDVLETKSDIDWF